MGLTVSKERFHEEKLRARALDSRLKVRERSAVEAKAQAEALQASLAALEAEADASAREAEGKTRALETELAEAVEGREEEARRRVTLGDALADRDAECARLGAALGDAVERAEKLETALERTHGEIREVQARARTLAEEKERLMAEASGSVASFAVREGGFDSPPRRAPGADAMGARRTSIGEGSEGYVSDRVAREADGKRTSSDGRRVAFSSPRGHAGSSEKVGSSAPGSSEVSETPEDLQGGDAGWVSPSKNDVTPTTPARSRERASERVPKGTTRKTPLTPASALIAQIVSFDSTSESEGGEDEPPHSYAEAVSRFSSGKASPDNVPAAQAVTAGTPKTPGKRSAEEYAQVARRSMDKALVQREGKGTIS